MTALTLIHAAPALDAAAGAMRAVATAGALTGEIVTTAGVLWCLNGAANATRTAYAAGAATRRLVNATLLPTADAISWVAAQIDWAETARTVWACLLAIGCAAYVAGEATGTAWKAWHTDWVGTIDWSTPQAPVVADPAPVVSRRQIDGSLTVKQLRRLAVDMGLPRSAYHAARKADLIATLEAA
jgi:hypothetical protein